LGYKGDVIKAFFLDFLRFQNSLSLELAEGRVDVHAGERENWLVHLIDSGVETETGGRLKRLSSWISDGTFMMTYGDGVADIDVRSLLAFHRRHGRLATLTAVRPPARFGALELAGDLVERFSEKPQTGDGWINGGYFVLEPEVLGYIAGDQTIFEHGPLTRLAEDGQLAAYRHEGFWHCMDTLRDVRLLNAMWSDGRAPWAVWKKSAQT
jgi:glucose-1-phosphate cytidylyltransferase